MNQEIGLEIKNLIIVPGHSCFKEEVKKVSDGLKDENNWILLPYQSGEVRFYLEHIEAALDLASKNSDSLLVFSGGYTRNGCGRWSESLTYKTIAGNKCVKCPDGNCTVPKRIALEELALDSLQNLEFSRNLYRKVVGKKPKNITVIGWEFKRERFDFHRQTLGISSSDFTYIGVNNPVNLEAALKGEKKTVELFRKNPWGNKEELLFKRRERNIKELTAAT